MKKFRVYSILVAIAILGVVLYSCNKDNFSEEDAMNLQAKINKDVRHENDSISVRNNRVSYTINLVDASTSALKSASQSSAIAGAVVKFVQDTMVVVKTADASGIVSISNAKPGNANVNITLANYSEVNYTVNIGGGTPSGGQQFSNIIPLIPIAGTSLGTLTGKVTYESDLTNLAPEIVPEGTRVIAMIDVNSDALPNTNNGIVSISYDKLSLSATTNASGNFSMTVPATIRGLDYSIIVPDFTVNQRLLQNKYNSRDTFGVVTIPAQFGNSFTSASTVDNVSPVVVKIDAPNYTVTPAAATAVIDNSNGIDHINITSNGGMYDEHSGYTLLLDNASIVNASTSNATATFDVNAYGRVTKITISGVGANYLAAAENYALTIPYCKTEAVVTFNTDASGVITSLNSITTQGKFYVKDPADVTFAYNGTNGSGAVFTPIFSYGGGGYYISGVTVTNGGTGYPASATNVSFNIKASGSLNQAATGTVHMTSSSLSAISVTNEGANYIGSVDVVIGAPNIPGGTQATATAVISNGKISAINLTNVGYGYTSVPTVTIKNKAEAIQAKYTGTATNGNVSSTFTKINEGNGYLTVPAVTIESAIPGVGTGASAYATLSGGKITGLTLVNAGNSYRGNTPSSAKNYSIPSVNVKGNGATIVNIDLGTGKRTIEQ